MYLNLLVGYLDRARKLVNWTEALISSITDPSQHAAVMHLPNAATETATSTEPSP